MKTKSRYTKALRNKIRVLQRALAEKLHPHVIKYVSIDGLSKVEPWTRSVKPEETRSRVGILPFDVQPLTENTVPSGMQVHRRVYQLRDIYVDPENGNRVFEYRERL